MTEQVIVKPGDTVLHVPSGEEWTVAAVDPSWNHGMLAAAGWPETWAAISVCKVIESCSDEESQATILSWAKTVKPDRRDGRVIRNRAIVEKQDAAECMEIMRL